MFKTWWIVIKEQFVLKVQLHQEYNMQFLNTTVFPSHPNYCNIKGNNQQLAYGFCHNHAAAPELLSWSIPVPWDIKSPVTP